MHGTPGGQSPFCQVLHEERNQTVDVEPERRRRIPALAKAGYLGTIVFGGLHAAASLYWGFGGDAFLETIGRGAVEWKESASYLVPLVLIPIGLAKAAAVAVPILNSQGRLPARRLLRIASWLGAGALLLYGGTYATLAWLSLAGRFGDVQDVQGMQGHAYIWDPLFALWGACLLVALAFDPRPRGQHGR